MENIEEFKLKMVIIVIIQVEILLMKMGFIEHEHSGIMKMLISKKEIII